MRLFMIVLGALLAMGRGARAADPATTRAAIEMSADALGGRAKVLALRSLQIDGQGQLAYEPGGGAVSADPYAPANTLSVTSSRVIDFAAPGMRFQERRTQNFIFANARNMLGHVVVDQRLYGRNAYDRVADGRLVALNEAAARARRLERLGNPISIVRAALSTGAQLGALKRSGEVSTFVLRTDAGDEAIVALDRQTWRPAWISWAAPHPNLGEATYRTRFTGYLETGAFVLPTGYTTTIDFHDLVDRTLSVFAYRYDAELEPPGDLPPTPPVEPQTVETRTVAPGIWYLRPPTGANAILVELDDHLALFELPASGERAAAILAAARAAVPGKPLTELVVSHQHYGHSAGLRTAVSEGLTIVTQTANAAFFREIAARMATRFPDALDRHPQSLKLRTIEDSGTLGGGERTLRLFHLTDNTHMAGGLMAYAPWARSLIQADLFDVGWDLYWWGQAYRLNVGKRGLDPVLDVAVHGTTTPFAEALTRIDRLIDDTAAFCRSADEARRPLQGCPVSPAW